MASIDLEFLTREGRKILSWRAAPEVDGKGTVTSILVIARDITRQTEEERTRLKLAAAIDTADEGIALVEPDGTVSYVNAAFSRITGYEKTELAENKIDILSRESPDPSAMRSISEAVAGGAALSGRFVLRRKGGDEFKCDLRVSPVKNASGSVTSFVGLIRDVSREATLEEQLRESQRLEAVGTLSGGIAHDFNNLLAVILGNAELAADDMPQDSPTLRNLNQVLTAAIRGRDLVKQILAFSRKSAQHVKPFRLTPLIEETAKLLRSTLPTTIEIRFDPDAPEDTLVADPTQIQQVLLNLATNAGHAMVEGG
ncbi:MAG: Blue-light-activated protein [Syntrophorhabdaceae bacterium PtaU1.Bin034]|nr:MAG: Blue-light-activated protein [Syntrophorhabdaceae bacterium PtaU1.Bin034]